MLDLARIPVGTSKLKIGMYVGMLDRPWIETPFVFQGFLIKDQAEIEQLQSYCSQVFIEVERGELTEAEIHAIARTTEAVGKSRAVAHQEKVKLPTWMQRLLVRMGIGDFVAERIRNRTGSYASTATVRREAPRARTIYEQAVTAYRDLFRQARKNSAVDIAGVTGIVTPLLESILRNPDAMAWTVFSIKRSGRNYSRAVATAVWAIMFGRHLGFNRKGLENLGIGGLLLDIGNVALSDELLNAAGAMDNMEYKQVLKHVQAGIDILRRSKDVDPAIFEMLVYHHERCDGSGYPNHLEGSDITPHGRIAGIVDCYDAMTTKTSYSPALSAYDAARELNDMRGKQFHAEVVEQFLKTIGMFPTGSVVELNDGSIGLVLEQNRANSLQPKVLVIRDAGGEMLMARRILNESDWPESNLWIAKGHEHGAFGIDPMDYFN